MKTQIDFEKLCKEELGFEIVTDDFTRIAKQKGLESFETYEYWETLDGDNIYMKTPYKWHEGYNRYTLDFEDFDPSHFVCIDPSFFSDEIIERIEYGETIFCSEYIFECLEIDFEYLAENNGLIEEEDEEV